MWVFEGEESFTHLKVVYIRTDIRGDTDTTDCDTGKTQLLMRANMLNGDLVCQQGWIVEAGEEHGGRGEEGGRLLHGGEAGQGGQG